MAPKQDPKPKFQEGKIRYRKALSSQLFGGSSHSAAQRKQALPPHNGACTQQDVYRKAVLAEQC